MAKAGIASSTGSNTERMRPTRVLASRSCSVASRKSATSCAAVPSVLTTDAASKLAWATSATCARSACARETAGVIARRYTALATRTAGSTAIPITPSQTSAASIAPAAMTSMTATPIASGSGTNTSPAASASALACERSAPVGWRRCHAIGSSR